jgi:hypothetical protein
MLLLREMLSDLTLLTLNPPPTPTQMLSTTKLQKIFDGGRYLGGVSGC